MRWLILFALLMYGPGAWAVPPKIAAGRDWAYILMPDGTLWEWGTNTIGEQFGRGSSVQTIDHPVPVVLNSGYLGVSASSDHTVYLRNDGSISEWYFSGTYVLPARYGARFVSVAAGGNHGLALQDDGSLWAWADSSHDEAVGNGSTWDSPYYRAPVNIGTGYTSISAGGTHSLAIKNDGSLWAWGRNYFGQLGDGTTITRNVPVLVGYGFTKVAAGNEHSLALKADGSLWAWGKNRGGQLGDGNGGEVMGTSIGDSLIPKKIGTGFVEIAAGNDHSVGIKSDGSVWAWGNNVVSISSTNSVDLRSSKVPVQISELSPAVAISAGWGYSLVVKSDGSVWIWGRLIGSESRTGTPVQVMAGTGVVVPTATLLPSELRFTNPTEQQTVLLTNTSTVELDIDSVTISSSDFSLTSNACSGTLQAGASCEIGVTFSPVPPDPYQSPGHTGKLTVVSNAQSEAITSSLFGYAPPTVSFSMPSLRFEKSEVGIAKTIAVHGSLTNSTSSIQGVPIDAITVSGDFSIVSNDCGKLVPIDLGAYCHVSVAYNPSVSGSRIGVLSAKGYVGVSPTILDASGDPRYDPATQILKIDKMKVDGVSYFDMGVKLKSDGRWNLLDIQQDAVVARRLLVGFDDPEYSAATNLLDMQRVDIDGALYSVGIVLRGDGTWQVPAVFPSYAGQWRPASGDSVFMVKQHRKQLTITDYSAGATYSGSLITDTTAKVVYAFEGGELSWNLIAQSSTQVAMSLDHCTAAPGYVCYFPNGTSFILNRRQ